MLGRDARGEELFVGEGGDGLHAGREVLPEGVDAGAPGNRPAIPTTAMPSDGASPSSGSDITLPSRERPAALLLEGGSLLSGALVEIARARCGSGRLALSGEVGSQRGDRGVAKHLDDGDVAAEGAGELVAHHGEQHRVAAEVEEVVFRADSVDPERVAPDAGNDGLGLAAGSDVVRRGRAPPSASRSSARASTAPSGWSGISATGRTEQESGAPKRSWSEREGGSGAVSPAETTQAVSS